MAPVKEPEDGRRAPLGASTQPGSAPESGATARQRLSNLYGALRATRPFPGKKRVREQVGLVLCRARGARNRE
jgi:hypothetical protein